jgi:hypothetical protein
MRHRSYFVGSRCALVALLVDGAAAVANAQPWPCDDPAPDCTGIPYLSAGQSWIFSPAWKPNRLPGVTFSLMNGNFCADDLEGNGRGLVPWWCDHWDDPNCTFDQVGIGDPPVFASGVLHLVSRLEGAYADGFRRFLLYVPAGSVWGELIDHDGNPNTPRILYGQEYIASSQWWTIPPEKRSLLIDELDAWRANRTDAQIEIYSTFPMASDPGSRCLGLPMNHTYYTDTEAFFVNSRCAASGQDVKIHGCGHDCVVYGPDPQIQLDVCLFHENIEPWTAPELGVRRFWLDSAAAVSGDPMRNFFPKFLQLAHCPLYRDVNAPGYPNLPHFLGMEAIPTLEPQPGQYLIDMQRAITAPAIAFSEFIQPRDEEKTWDVSASAETTELVAVLDPTNPWTLLDPSTGAPNGVFALLDWARRGFVVYIPNPESTLSRTIIEYTKRVYDMGILSARLDFNGKDGVTAQDLTDFNAQWNAYNGETTGCNWVHGDVDGDNDVDLADKNKFMLWWNAPRPPGQQFPSPVPINLGEAEPDDVFVTPN